MLEDRICKLDSVLYLSNKQSFSPADLVSRCKDKKGIVLVVTLSDSCFSSSSPPHLHQPQNWVMSDLIHISQVKTELGL